MRKLFGKALSSVREAAWLDVSFIKICGGISLFLLSCIFCGAFVFYSCDFLTQEIVRYPFGDYHMFWAAGKLAMADRVSEIYHVGGLYPMLENTKDNLAEFLYTPVSLFLYAPLAALPYLSSHALFAGIGICALAAVSYKAFSYQSLWFLAVPFFWINLLDGQNGFFIASFMIGGVLLLDKHPVKAGICWSFLLFKPHFMLLLPVYLWARQEKKALLSFLVSFLSLVLCAAFVFGGEIWHDFLEMNAHFRDILPERVVHPRLSYRLASAFTFLKQIGVPTLYAILLHGAIFAALLAWLYPIWKKKGDTLMGISSFIMAALLLPPNLFVYDLVVLLFPMGWLFKEALKSGFFPWEKMCLIALWALVFLMVTVFHAMNVSPACFFLLLFAYFVVQRGQHDINQQTIAG